MLKISLYCPTIETQRRIRNLLILTPSKQCNGERQKANKSLIFTKENLFLLTNTNHNNQKGSNQPKVLCNLGYSFPIKR